MFLQQQLMHPFVFAGFEFVAPSIETDFDHTAFAYYDAVVVFLVLSSFPAW